MLVSLAECLYGMNLYKKRFLSDEAEKLCLSNIIQYFIKSHSNGKLVGPIDIRKFQIDLEDGNVSFPDNEQMDGLFSSIDTIKYMPPEILRDKSSWSKYSDHFLLSTILFSVKFFAHPFDGMQIYENPVAGIRQAMDFYSNPMFIFDVVDTRNQVLGYNDGRVIFLWDNCVSEIKDYFVRSFTSGIAHVDMRIDEEDVLKIFCIENDIDVRMLEINDKKFALKEGLEIYEKDIDINTSSNHKVLVVIKSTKDKNVLALGNASNDTWSVYLPDSKEIMVSPKLAAPIVKGATISIGEYLANII